MLSIRPGHAGDLAQVAALETGRDTAMWLGETGLAWHEHALADPDQEHLVADDGGQLAGFALTSELVVMAMPDLRVRAGTAGRRR